jgi:hypothetical protein
LVWLIFHPCACVLQRPEDVDLPLHVEVVHDLDVLFFWINLPEANVILGAGAHERLALWQIPYIRHFLSMNGESAIKLV